MAGIDIILGDDIVELKPTLRAAKLVSGLHGGFQGTLARLAAMDMDAYIAIVAAGLNKKPAEIEDKVFNAGLPNLTEPLSSFVMLLANGGRPLSQSEQTSSGEA